VKVWIDLSNSPHPLLFTPIRVAFEEEGHTVLMTARDNAQTLELARQRWPDVKPIGGRSPGGRIAKSRALASRPMISSVGRGRSSPMSHSHTTRMRKSSPHASPAFPWSLARFAALPHRVYAFADPLQMIYGWRDASPQRLTAFRADGASEHTLRTLHRYRTRPDLQRWMEQVRDVLLGGRERVDVARPEEVRSIEYDPTLAERGRIFGAPARELYPSDETRIQACQGAYGLPVSLP
jgi:hypothetical protein